MRTFEVIRGVAARFASHHTRHGEDGLRLRRIRIMGVALVAVVVISAMVVSAAQAITYGRAEYGRCLKTAKVNGHYTGSFTNANCIESGVNNKKYEWYPGLSGPASRPRYTAKTKALTVGEASVGSLQCKAGTDVGEITGVEKGWDISTATGCIGGGSGYAARCNSPGAPPETVETAELETRAFSVLSGGPTEAWTEYSGYPYVDIECPGLAQVVVYAWVSGISTPTNKMTTKFTTDFTTSGGEQDLEFYYSDPICTDCGPDPATLERTSLMKFQEKWEIRVEP